MAISLKNLYCLLIIISLAMVCGRIAVVEDVASINLQTYRINQALQAKQKQWKSEGRSRKAISEKSKRYLQQVSGVLQTRRPTLSANDRSRWAIIRVLAEPQMRVEGSVYAIDKVIQQPGWDTIDMVKHNGHLYSSKPPLLPTIQAGIYWLVIKTTGMTCVTHPFECVRTVVFLSHIPCLLILFIMTILTVEQLTTDNFTRIFTLMTICFGTYLSTFAITLQNHLPGTAAVSIALYAIVRIVLNPSECRWPIYFLAGLFSSFAVACELPALAFFAALMLVCFIVDWRKSLIGFVPGLTILLIGFFAANYAAHSTLIPPYAQRQEDNNWYLYTYERGDGVVRQSYWHNRVGIDRGEPSRAIYAYNVLFGHHGIFFLTPLWAFSFAGAVTWLLQWRQKPQKALLGFFILSMSLVVIGFYIMRPLDDRNYGGITCVFRWALWLIPLWIAGLIPILEKAAQQKWLMAILYAALFWSVLAANTALVNPWTHPWIYRG